MSPVHRDSVVRGAFEGMDKLWCLNGVQGVPDVAAAALSDSGSGQRACRRSVTTVLEATALDSPVHYVFWFKKIQLWLEWFKRTDTVHHAQRYGPLAKSFCTGYTTGNSLIGRFWPRHLWERQSTTLGLN